MRHTSRFLSIYCLTLPIVLAADLGFATAPVVALVTWGLFGIQEIGLIIEDPFQQALELSVIAKTIDSDVKESLYGSAEEPLYRDTMTAAIEALDEPPQQIAPIPPPPPPAQPQEAAR